MPRPNMLLTRCSANCMGLLAVESDLILDRIEVLDLGERRPSQRLNQIAAKPNPLSQGFDADHRDIELLKLRNFTVGKKIPDSVFTADDSQDQIADIIRAMVGYVSGTCYGSM